MHDFDKLWNRTHDHEAKLCAFDLLELDGEDYRPKPLAERKKKLFKLLRRAWRGIEYVEHLEGDGAVIFEHACKLGLEGIVCKRIDLPYRPGPSKSWIKVKNKKHPAMLRVKEAFELKTSGAADGLLPGPPMDLANMRENGVRSLSVDCLDCHHEASVMFDDQPGHLAVPSFAGRMKCSKCGSKHMTVMPDWNSRPNRIRTRARSTVRLA